MQVMTAKEAKVRFGELITSMQKEPVLITKNNRPVGAFISLEDLRETSLAQRFLEDAQSNDTQVRAYLREALVEFDRNGSTGTEATSDFYDEVLNQVKQRLIGGK